MLFLFHILHMFVTAPLLMRRSPTYHRTAYNRQGRPWNNTCQLISTCGNQSAVPLHSVSVADSWLHPMQFRLFDTSYVTFDESLHRLLFVRRFGLSVQWHGCTVYIYLFPCHLFEDSLCGKQNFHILHNKVTSCPAMTVRASVLAGETLIC
jgi:hypothetical protein